jgi:hypothetical protein
MIACRGIMNNKVCPVKDLCARYHKAQEHPNTIAVEKLPFRVEDGVFSCELFLGDKLEAVFKTENKKWETEY